MKLVSEKSVWPRLLVFPLLGISASVFALVWLSPQLAYKFAYCPLRQTTGLPCLTCGGTHSIVALSQGHWTEALAANPLVAGGIFIFCVWALYALAATFASGLRRSVEMSPSEKRTARILAVLIIVSTWIWEIWQFCR